MSRPTVAEKEMINYYNGSMLTMNHWHQANKNSLKHLRAREKRPQLVLQGYKIPLKNVFKCFSNR